MRRSVVAVALGVASTLWGAVSRAQAPQSEPVPARAGAPTRVALVAGPGIEELVVRFVAELDSLRLEVVRPPDVAIPLPSTSELERLAEEQGARVAVGISRAGKAVDLWVVNPQSHEVVYRRVVAEGDPAILVLRSLEILRGALVDLRAVEQEPTAPMRRVAPPKTEPEARELAPPTEAPASWLGLSGGLIGPHAGRSLAPSLLLTLHQRLDSRFALHAEALAPLHDWEVEGDGGRTKVWLGGVTLAGLVNPWSDRMFSPGLGLGVGALALHTRGQPDEGYRGASGLTTAIFPHARFELALTLTVWLRVRAAVVAGFATPRPVLLFGDTREQTWLNPLLSSSLGAEAALP